MAISWLQFCYACHASKSTLKPPLNYDQDYPDFQHQNNLPLSRGKTQVQVFKIDKKKVGFDLQKPNPSKSNGSCYFFRFERPQFLDLFQSDYLNPISKVLKNWAGTG